MFTSCSSQPSPVAVENVSLSSSPTSLLPSQTSLPVAMSTSTFQPTQTATITQTPQYTATVKPEHVYLRGQVNVEHANCRYGPGAPYLYKYGLVGGSNLEIIARNASGTWIEIRAIGGNNPCWVSAKLLDIQGNVMDLVYIRPEDVRLPRSPYYTQPTGVRAVRNGTEVEIAWNPVGLRAGDDSGQFLYLIEAWVCMDGQITFTPTGAYETRATIIDEPGCATPSHGRVYAVEKHGYTKWVSIPWP